MCQTEYCRASIIIPNLNMDIRWKSMTDWIYNNNTRWWNYDYSVLNIVNVSCFELFSANWHWSKTYLFRFF